MNEHEVPYHICQAGASDEAKAEALIQDLKKGHISLAYVTFGQLDALMHRLGTENTKISQLLHYYEEQFDRIVEIAKQSYHVVNVYLFADHGMHDVTAHYDLQKDINALGLRYGYDYVAVYDSTMARFWYLNDKAEHLIKQRLTDITAGRLLTDAELQSFGTYFPDHRYGQSIFLMNSSTLIVPSFMGRKAIPGMHGYHPNDPESYAALLSNCVIPDDVQAIQHIFKIMLRELNDV